MKILMVLMDRRSGMFQYASLLSNALSQTEQVAVIAPSGSEASFFNASVKLIKLPVGDTKKNFAVNTLNPLKMNRFLQTVRQEQPDIIHFHNAYVVWPCLFFPWLRQYKKIVSLPDGAMLPGQHRLDKIISRKIHIKNADGIILVSNYDRELASKEYPDKKYFVIPHGANTLYLPSDNNGPTGEADKSDILFFGGLQEYKGFEYLLKAIPVILQKRPGTTITLAVHGDLARYRPLLATSPNVRIYHNFIPHRQVAALFRGTQVVALPYVYRIHSGVIPVACAFGKPMVATNCLDEQIEEGKTGITVPPRNEQALAEALVAVLNDDDLRAAMSMNALARAKNELNWANIAAKTLAAYRNVIEG